VAKAKRRVRVGAAGAKKSPRGAASRSSPRVAGARILSRTTLARESVLTLGGRAARGSSAARTRAATKGSGAPAKQTPRSIHKDILAYNAAQSPGDKRICDALAKAIQRTLTDSGASGVESKIWHRHPVWFIDGNPIVGYHKLKDCVRLLFWSGRSFDEPGLAPEGGFQTAGARYTSASEISPTDLNRWLDKSVEIQWDYKNIVKRKGRLERLPSALRAARKGN
jgi:hypothetical protein